jgi:hypothetical protein
LIDIGSVHFASYCLTAVRLYSNLFELRTEISNYRYYQ